MLPVVLSLVPRAYFPELRGGLEITARNTLGMLSGLPVDIHLAAATSSGSARLAVRIARKLMGPYQQRYRIDQHQVHADLYHPIDLAALIERLKPVALICHMSGAGLVQEVIDADIPTMFYVHGYGIKDALEKTKGMRMRRFAAESRFIGDLVTTATGELTEIIRPPLDPLDYRVDTKGDAVLVVNPHPMKGGQHVVKLAKALPHRRFLVVGGWAHTKANNEVILVEQALAQLPNVERISHLDDMRIAFRRSRCLLMPCVVEEAYGRAAAEAMIAGIPVLASDRGALPETIGGGGVTLSLNAPLDAWISQLDSMFLDEAYYQRLVMAAYSQAAEPDRQPAHVSAQLKRVIGELLGPAGRWHAA
jgi:glycosyltransferase involved in cell wall biosynthesis